MAGAIIELRLRCSSRRACVERGDKGEQLTHCDCWKPAPKQLHTRYGNPSENRDRRHSCRPARDAVWGHGSMVYQPCLLIGGQQRAHRSSVAAAPPTGKCVHAVGTIPSEPFLDGAEADADDFGGFFEGFAASGQGEHLEALGDVAVAFAFVACVEFVGRAFLFHEQFSSAYRCSSCVCGVRDTNRGLAIGRSVDR
jgi:hypothetical protein